MAVHLSDMSLLQHSIILTSTHGIMVTCYYRVADVRLCSGILPYYVSLYYTFSYLIMTRLGLGIILPVQIGFPPDIIISLIVFLNISYVFHVLVVFNTSSDWFDNQSLARVLPVPACIIILINNQ
jgi:hypothetical protein